MKLHCIHGGVAGGIIVKVNENFLGSVGQPLLAQGQPVKIRASFTRTSAMPEVARYLDDTLKVKALEPYGIRVVADLSTDPGQLDFSGPVLKAKQGYD